MSKLWLCGICQNNLKDIDELTKNTAHIVDGLVWFDHYSTDGTYELLKERCGLGLIAQGIFNKDHSWSMNGYLKNGVIKHGDWVIQIDTSERIHPDFLHKLKNGMLNNLEEASINIVFQRSKPIMFKYHDTQFFAGTPHWGLQGMMPYIAKINEFDGYQDDKTYYWSLRDDINKWIVNGIKYYLTYPISNHIWLVYGKETEDSKIKREQQRYRFRGYCRKTLGFNIENVNDIKAYLEKGEFTKEFIDYMNSEKIIANYYRYINGENQQVIYDTQNQWKFN